MNRLKFYFLLISFGLIPFYFLSEFSIVSASDLPERVKSIDKNKNGFIDRDEALGPLKDNFDEIDVNNDGVINGKEISSFFEKKYGSKSKNAKSEQNTSNALPTQIKFLDKNNNNLIEKKEASGFIASKFSSIDKNSDDVIDSKELNIFFTSNKKGVYVDKVKKIKLSQTVTVIGRLVGNANGPISSKVSGTISEVLVKIGDKVKKNEPMIKIQQDDFEMEAQRRFAIVKQRQSQVKIAQAEFEKISMDKSRIEALKDSSVYSKKIFQNIQQDIVIKKSLVNERESLLEQAIEELNRANLKLKNTTILSPFSGVVIKINSGVGSFISTGTTVVNLLDISNVEISAQVPSNILSSLKIGEKVLINFDEYSDQYAFVRAIIPNEDQLTRTSEVRLSFEDKNIDYDFVLNKSVNILMPIYKKGEGITVHKDAVISKNNESFVYVVSQGKVKRKLVSLIGSNGNRFIVKSGLKEGQLVVIRGNESLRDNQNIRIIDIN